MKPTHAKKGGKSTKKAKLKDHDRNKEKAVSMVMANLAAEAKKLEQSAVMQILVKHLGRDLIKADVDKIEKGVTEHGYILHYDGVALGEITRYSHEDQKAESNYKVEFQPYEL